MLRKKYFIFILIFISLALIGSYIIITENPYRIVKSKFNLVLPTSSEVINYDYDRFHRYFEAKIKINEENIEPIKNTLLEYFKYEYFVKTNRDLHSFNKTPNWWTLDISNILICFRDIGNGLPDLSGGMPNTAFTWAIITKEDDGQNFLYVDFMISPWTVLIANE